MHFIKKQKIYEYKNNNSNWWISHTMAPSAIYWKNKIRVFLGAWDENPISRITYIDLDPENPTNILKINDKKPVLDIGKKGMFDDNGVFPAHATVINRKIYLYYTGFQNGTNIPHYNFGGLAVSEDGENFSRISQAPILDRADEGLLVRAGQSVLKENNIYKTTYSVGNSFSFVGGKSRPTYDIAYQDSKDGISYKKEGNIILRANHEIEHGLGRPQITKIKDLYYIFYTRRMRNMKYFIGCAKSKDCITWEKDETIFSKIKHSDNNFDSDMIYFPSLVNIPDTDKYFLFYCGNNFGETGFGYCELEKDFNDK